MTPKKNKAKRYVECSYALQRARIKASLTQEEVGSIAGISERSVRTAESGERVLYETASKLIKALNLNQKEILRYDSMNRAKFGGRLDLIEPGLYVPAQSEFNLAAHPVDREDAARKIADNYTGSHFDLVADEATEEVITILSSIVNVMESQQVDKDPEHKQPQNLRSTIEVRTRELKLKSLLDDLYKMDYKIYHSILYVGWQWHRPDNEYPSSETDGTTPLFFIAEGKFNYVYCEVVGTHPLDKYNQIKYRPRNATELLDAHVYSGQEGNFSNGLFELGTNIKVDDLDDIPF